MDQSRQAQCGVAGGLVALGRGKRAPAPPPAAAAAATRSPWTGFSHPWAPGARPGSAPPASASLSRPCCAPASAPSTRRGGRPGTTSTAPSPRRPSPLVSVAVVRGWAEAAARPDPRVGGSGRTHRHARAGVSLTRAARAPRSRSARGGGSVGWRAPLGPICETDLGHSAQGLSAPPHRPGRRQCFWEDHCGQNDHRGPGRALGGLAVHGFLLQGKGVLHEQLPP